MDEVLAVKVEHGAGDVMRQSQHQVQHWQLVG
jgi:hypothetical protein